MPATVASAASYVATTITSSSFLAFAGKMALSYGLNVVASDLMAEDRKQSSRSGLSQKLSMTKNPTQPRRVIYGRTRVGGDLVFYDVNNSGRDLHMVCTFAAHPCEEIETIYLDGQPLSLDQNGVARGKYSNANVVVNKHLGNQTSADQELVNNVAVWGQDDVGYNQTYVYLRAEADNREDHRELFNGMPSISATVRGKNDIYDPRTDTTGYTNNPALCTRDFITHPLFGYGFPGSMIDDDDTIASANVCDETVGSETRYECNGSFRDSARNDDVLRDLVSSMAGETVFSQGRQRILAGYWRPTVMTLDESDPVSSISVSPKQSRGDLYNTVRGTHPNPQKKFQPTSFPQVQEPRFVDEDDGNVIPKTLELPFTTSTTMAQRISRIVLRKHRNQMTLSTTNNIESFNIQAGDNVRWNVPRYGFDSKPFHVTSWNFELQNDGAEGESGFLPVCSMNMVERDSGVYNDIEEAGRNITSPAVRFED